MKNHLDGFWHRRTFCNGKFIFLTVRIKLNSAEIMGTVCRTGRVTAPPPFNLSCRFSHMAMVYLGTLDECRTPVTRNGSRASCVTPQVPTVRWTLQRIPGTVPLMENHTERELGEIEKGPVSGTLFWKRWRATRWNKLQWRNQAARVLPIRHMARLHLVIIARVAQPRRLLERNDIHIWFPNQNLGMNQASSWVQQNHLRRNESLGQRLQLIENMTMLEPMMTPSSARIGAFCQGSRRKHPRKNITNQVGMIAFKLFQLPMRWTTKARAKGRGEELGMFLATVNFIVRRSLDSLYCRSNPPEVSDDADRIDRSARGSSSRHNVNKDDSRHENGKTKNLIDESDDESRHSNMEFSMG